jgi:hypothetical protein
LLASKTPEISHLAATTHVVATDEFPGGFQKAQLQNSRFGLVCMELEKLL